MISINYLRVVSLMQEARPLLLKAHGSLLKYSRILNVMSNLRYDHSCSTECGELSSTGVQHSFIELGKVWQAPLYEITLNLRPRDLPNDGEGGIYEGFALA